MKPNKSITDMNRIRPQASRLSKVTWSSMSLKDMDDQITLNKFWRIFSTNTKPLYHDLPFQNVGRIYQNPLHFHHLLHISPDGSGSKQLDPLKNSYKKDLTPSAQGMFYYSLILVF